MLYIQDSKLIDSEGSLLKKLSCSKRIMDLVFETLDEAESLCTYCERNVLNTNFFDESEIIRRLGKEPSICLLINRHNPTFRVIE